MTLCPARLEPIFSARPWGALSLAPYFPEKTNLAEPIGEAWMTGNDCRFANGPWIGQTLGEAWPKMPVEWAGTRADQRTIFPLLVKFIFAEEKLSVQVHPGDEYAAAHERLPGGATARGKTEMWYAMRARVGAEVLAGLKPNVTREIFARAIAEGTAEDCLERVPLRAGEAIFVPAGTAHTIGAGLVLCEIQQHSDITYRVYDYNRRDAQGRSRELHIEKALEVMRFGGQSGGKIQPVRIERDGGLNETFFAACRYFVTEKWEISERVTAKTRSAHFELVVFFEGGGTISWDGGTASYHPAQVWLLPAKLGVYTIEPSAGAVTSLLQTYAPSNLDEVERQLREQGVDEAAMQKVIFP